MVILCVQSFALPAWEPPRPDHYSKVFGEEGEGLVVKYYCLEFIKRTETTDGEDITLRGLATEACYNPSEYI